MDGMPELLGSMSPGLRQEVSAHTCQVLVSQVPYFMGCSTQFLMECAAQFLEVVFAPMEVAIMRGTTVRHITIIRKGVMVRLDDHAMVILDSIYNHLLANTVRVGG